MLSRTKERTKSSNRTAWERISAPDPCDASMSTPGPAPKDRLADPQDRTLLAPERRRTPRVAEDGVFFQLVALGLQVSFIQYDLIVLQKTSSVASSFVGWNVPNRRSQIVVLMPKFTTCRW